MTHLRMDIQESDKVLVLTLIFKFNPYKMTSNLECDMQRLRKPTTYSHSRKVKFDAPHTGDDGGSMLPRNMHEATWSHMLEVTNLHSDTSSDALQCT